jgi:hypothetical protein
MAALLQLVRGSDTTDLVGGTDGFSLIEDAWVRTVAARNEDGTWPESVSEPIPLRVQGTSVNNLATRISSLETVLRQGSDYKHQPLDEDPVYLRMRLDGESKTYQSLVRRGTASPRVSFHSRIVDAHRFVRDYMLGLERKPFWEPTSHSTISATGLSASGGKYNYGSPTDVPGNAPARISLLRFSGTSGTSNTLTEVWAGFRTNRFTRGSVYSRTDFASFWDLSNATDLGADTATSSDSTVVYGDKLRTTFATQTGLVYRVAIAGNRIQAGLPYQAQRGRYLVLLRAKCNGTRTVNVRMQSGLQGTSNWRNHRKVAISSTSWYLYPLGYVDLPPLLYHPSWQNMLYFSTIRIQVESTGGSDNFDMDVIFMVPQAEGALHLDGVALRFPSGYSQSYAEVAVNPDDVVSSLSNDNQNVLNVPATSLTNYGLPTGEGLLMVVAQQAAEHDANDMLDVNLQYYPRWTTLRGNE